MAFPSVGHCKTPLANPCFMLHPVLSWVALALEFKNELSTHPVKEGDRRTSSLAPLQTLYQGSVARVLPWEEEPGHCSKSVLLGQEQVKQRHFLEAVSIHYSSYP